MSRTSEIWKDIEGYEGYYEISNLGRVRSLKRTVVFKDGRIAHYKDRILKYCISSDGYPCVGICRDSKQFNVAVHKLVGRYFVNGYQEGLELNHIDGNKMNPAASNLEWDTHLHNMRHAASTGLLSKRQLNQKKVIDKTTGKIFSSIREAADAYGIHKATLFSRIVRSKHKDKSNLQIL
jgi:hypothetical protein